MFNWEFNLYPWKANSLVYEAGFLCFLSHWDLAGLIPLYYFPVFSYLFSMKVAQHLCFVNERQPFLLIFVSIGLLQHRRQELGLTSFYCLSISLKSVIPVICTHCYLIEWGGLGIV